jgi:hypothetical protein
MSDKFSIIKTICNLLSINYEANERCFLYIKSQLCKQRKTIGLYDSFIHFLVILTPMTK